MEVGLIMNEPLGILPKNKYSGDDKPRLIAIRHEEEKENFYYHDP